jgi:hypothetical protein
LRLFVLLPCSIIYGVSGMREVRSTGVVVVMLIF